jgi:hypothetical protein
VSDFLACRLDILSKEWLDMPAWKDGRVVDMHVNTHVVSTKPFLE